MKVSQRLSTSLPYACDRSLYRRAFQNILSSILHYLLHTQTLLSSMSRAKGKILLASFKNSYITLQSWLMGFFTAFLLTTFFEIAIYHLEQNTLDYQSLFRKEASASRQDSRDQQKSSIETEIRAFYYYFFVWPLIVRNTLNEIRILDSKRLKRDEENPRLFYMVAFLSSRQECLL